MFQPKTRHCAGPFNWGGAHCAGEKMKRKTGPFLQKSHQKQARSKQGTARHGNPPARLPGTRAKKQKTPAWFRARVGRGTQIKPQMQRPGHTGRKALATKKESLRRRRLLHIELLFLNKKPGASVPSLLGVRKHQEGKKEKKEG